MDTAWVRDEARSGRDAMGRAGAGLVDVRGKLRNAREAAAESSAALVRAMLAIDALEGGGQALDEVRRATVAAQHKAADVAMDVQGVITSLDGVREGHARACGALGAILAAADEAAPVADPEAAREAVRESLDY